MSKLKDTIKESELLTLEPISRNEGEDLKNSLQKAKFESEYLEDHPTHEMPIYFKKNYKQVDENEYDLFLLYENLKINRKTEKHTRVIKNIIITYFVASAVIGIILLILNFI